jgi:hypothetical protein
MKPAESYPAWQPHLLPVSPDRRRNPIELVAWFLEGRLERRADRRCHGLVPIYRSNSRGVQTLPAQNLPRPASDRTLDQCEKELARDKELVACSFKKAKTVTKVSHKVYELSNTCEQKDVVKILKDHGLRDWKTIRTFVPSIKSPVTGKVFCGTSSLFVGIIVGGAVIVLEPNGPPIALPPERAPTFPIF